jgi:hypothetical protein
MRQIVLGILVTGVLTTPALAQTPADTPLKLDRALAGVTFVQPAAPRLALTPAPAQAAPADAPVVTVAAGADFPSAYYFRGYRQESDPALTFQPFIDVGVAAAEGLTLNFGTWNSLHTGSLSDADAGWYETDLYAAATMGMVKATYTAYTYPNIDDSAIHELMFSTTFDDSASAFPLAPSAAIAFELEKSSGADRGIYLELGVTPAIPMPDDAPVAISIPVRLGFSLKDYYGGDSLGYVSVGAALSVPINDRFEVHGSVTGFAFPGDFMEFYNDQSGAVVGSVGFGVKF